MIQRPSAALALERILPNSLEAEMAVLGAMFLDHEAVDKVMEKVTEPSMFYYAAHQVIYRETCLMSDELQKVDMVVLTGRLQDKGLLDEIGGAAYLADLISRVPTTANVDHYVQMVLNKYLLRQLIAASHDTMTQSFDKQDDVEQILADTMQRVQVLAEGSAEGGFVEAKELVRQAMEAIEKMMANRGALTGLASGFRDLDKLTCGFNPGEVIIIAARPSMGKTSLGMNIAEHVAIEMGLPVGVFSLEMSKEGLIKRMIASRAHVNIKGISTGSGIEHDFGKLTTAASEIIKAPIFIDDTAALSVSKMRARARRLVKSKGIKLLVIDYLQLMKCPGKQSDSNRQVEVALISQGVKQIAKENGVPIILLAQLNRKPDEREAGKPKMSDLRESGQIEQDADIIGLLVRPEVNTEDPEEKAKLKGQAILIIAKNRDGATGEIPLAFIGEHTRFEDAAKVDENDYPQN